MVSLLKSAGRAVLPRRGPKWPQSLAQVDAAIATASARLGRSVLVASALARAPLACFSAEEMRWIDRIERIRKTTTRSTQAITVRDYGARKPGDALSDADMAEGVLVRKIVGEICRIASKGPASAAVLFSLIRQLKPQRCVEMGTCVGISGAYIGAALALNGAGRLVSLEGDEAVAAIARRNFAALGLAQVTVVVGPFHRTLVPALAAATPVDFLFVDGHHDEHATQRYFETALDYLAADSLAVFDDINWSDGMRRAWHAVAAHPACVGTFSLSDFGIALVNGRATA